MANEAQIKRTLIQRILNRVDLTLPDPQIPANLIWLKPAAMSRAAFRARRVAWFASLVANAETTLTAPITASASTADPKNAHPAALANATFHGEIKTAAANAGKQGLFEEAYDQMFLFLETLDHHAEEHCKTLVGAAFIAGYDAGYADCKADRAKQGTAKKNAYMNSFSYSGGASAHNTY